MVGLKLFVLFALVAIASGKRPAGIPKPGPSNIETLSAKDSFNLRLQSILSPNTLPTGLVAQIREMPDWWNKFYDDFVNIELRQLLLQSKKLGPNDAIPEYQYGFRFAFCLWWWCIDEEVNYKTAGTRLQGTETITSETSITPTVVKNIYHIGNLNITIPGYLVNVTDYIDQRISLTKGWYLSLEGTTLGLQFNYGMVEGVGIQISNLSIHWNPGRTMFANYMYETYNFNGELISSSPGDTEAGEYLSEALIDVWTYTKRESAVGFEWILNCFLSNGKSDEECYMNEESEQDYVTFSNVYYVQFFQALLFGELV